MAGIEKKCMVEQFAKEIESCSGIFLLGFKKFSAINANNLRRELSGLGSRCRVVKNRIFRQALLKTKLEQIETIVDGPTTMALFSEGPTVVAKKIYEFCKGHEGLEIKGGWFAGRLLTASEIREIANLPDRPVLLSMIVNGINGPLSRLVRVLKGNLTALVRTLDAIKKNTAVGSTEGKS